MSALTPLWDVGEASGRFVKSVYAPTLEDAREEVERIMPGYKGRVLRVGLSASWERKLRGAAPRRGIGAAGESAGIGGGERASPAHPSGFRVGQRITLSRYAEDCGICPKLRARGPVIGSVVGFGRNPRLVTVLLDGRKTRHSFAAIFLQALNDGR